MSWGFKSVAPEKEVLDMAKSFQDSQLSDAVASSDDRGSGQELQLIAADSPPTVRMRGRLVIRFVSATAWEKPSLKADMMKNPGSHLFLGFDSISFTADLQRPPHSDRSLEESMLKLQRDGESEGDVTFIVGERQTRIRAHSIIVSAATPVQLFRRGMIEGNAKEVTLPQFKVKVFRYECGIL